MVIERQATVVGWGVVTVKMSEFEVPVPVVTVTGPVTAPGGRRAVMSV